MIRSARLMLLWLTLWTVSTSMAAAQTPPASSHASTPSAFDAGGALSVGATEWRTTLGIGWSVVLFQSADGHKYVQQTVSWGRILSGPKFSGFLRGRFEWAVEVTPIYGQYNPDNVYGIGISPLDWRWNFEPRGRYSPFVELASGLMKSTSPIPQSTSSANFTASGGGGVRILVAHNQSVVVAYRFDHISNGNRLADNPGLNAHAIHVGWSLLQPPKRAN